MSRGETLVPSNLRFTKTDNINKIEKQNNKLLLSENKKEIGNKCKISNKSKISNKNEINLFDKNVLIGEFGDILIRRVGKTDTELRRRKVKSVVERLPSISEEDENIINNVIDESAHKVKWKNVNLGKTFISDKTIFNLYAAVPG